MLSCFHIRLLGSLHLPTLKEPSPSCSVVYTGLFASWGQSSTHTNNLSSQTSMHINDCETDD